MSLLTKQTTEMPNHGILDKDLIGATLSIRGKLLIDRNRNILNAANISARNINVRDALSLNVLQQKTPSGILVNGDLVLGNGFDIIGNIQGDIVGDICGNLTTSLINAKDNANGLKLNRYLPTYKFGLGRVYRTGTASVSNITAEFVEFAEKTFESGFTTASGIVHPSGNSLVTFQAPSTSDIDYVYSNAIVRVDIALGVQVSGDAGDNLIFTVRKNQTTSVSEFRHELLGPCINADATFAWSDLVVCDPGDRLDVFAIGTGSGNIVQSLIVGGSRVSWAAFAIESFQT